MTFSKSQMLEKLNNEMKNDASLSLAQGATNLVPGEGNPDADILFIGEAPGKNEDEQGRPFVGAAGKFLDELIASIGMSRDDVFIANLIKHRPPGNRDPLPEEIAAYTPWLEKQIAIIKPLVFVTLGRYSMQYMLGPNLSISRIHGEPKRKADRVVMPMYHPAAALYRGNLREVMKADFAKIPKVLELINNPPTPEPEPQQETQQTLL